MTRVTRTTRGRAVLRFGATLGNRSLSNFSACRVRGAFGHLYPSSEHAWQATKARSEGIAKRFAVGGDLAELALAAFRKFYPKTAAEKLEKKLKYWSRGNSVGIIAKMAANKTYAKRINIPGTGYAYELEHVSEAELRKVWLPILRDKYTRNEDMRTALLGTGDKYLLEFDRGARRRESFWGGIDEEDGTVTGRNFMGEILMDVRKELKEKSNEK